MTKDTTQDWDGARWDGRSLYTFAPAMVAVQPRTDWYFAFGQFVELSPGAELVPEGGCNDGLVCRVVDAAWPPGLRVQFPLDKLGQWANEGPAGRVDPTQVLRCGHVRPVAGCRRCLFLALRKKADAEGVEWDADA